MIKLKKIILAFVGLICTGHSLIAQLTCKELAREMARGFLEAERLCQYENYALQIVLRQQGLTYDEMQEKITQVSQKHSTLYKAFNNKKDRYLSYVEDFKKNNCDQRLVAEMIEKLEPEFPHI